MTRLAADLQAASLYGAEFWTLLLVPGMRFYSDNFVKSDDFKAWKPANPTILVGWKRGMEGFDADFFFFFCPKIAKDWDKGMYPYNDMEVV